MIHMIDFCFLNFYSNELLTVNFVMYSEFQYLNTNHILYDAVKRAELESHLLTEEAQRAAHYLRADFERGGIHLCSGTYSSFLSQVLLKRGFYLVEKTI